MRPFVTLVLVACSAAAVAAPGPAATDPAQADADFPFVGEYVGTVSTLKNGRWRTVQIGLQVAAIGDGRFEATEYFGGLPGAGWNGRLRAVLPGRRDEGVVHIDAEPTGITLDGVTGRVGAPGQGTAYGLIRRINRASPTLGRSRPAEATVLFDGSDTGAFSKVKISEDGLLMPGAETKDVYSDFTLHVEFRLPYMPGAKDQARANSGVYLQRRYEVQIHDSFGDDPVFNNAASLYRTKPADLNMSFPPLAWQTYDIRFRPARFEDGRKVENARLTVWHNGVKVQSDYPVPNKTGAGKPEGPEPMPILFQDHGNPIRFRNVWIVDHAKHPDVDATPKIASPAATPVVPVTRSPQFVAAPAAIPGVMPAVVIPRPVVSAP